MSICGFSTMKLLICMVFMTYLAQSHVEFEDEEEIAAKIIDIEESTFEDGSIDDVGTGECNDPEAQEDNEQSQSSSSQ